MLEQDEDVKKNTATAPQSRGKHVSTPGAQSIEGCSGKVSL